MKKIIFVADLLVIIGVLTMSAVCAWPAGSKPKIAEVSIDNFTFEPQSLIIPIHTTVTWVNHDDIPHVIVSNDGVFHSKALDTDDKFSFVFTKAGTYEYFCGLHPKMVGKIVVQ